MSRPWKERISPATRRVMEALFDTIIPSGGPARPGAIDFNLVDRLLDWFGQMTFAAPAFILVCRVWDFSPLLFLRFRRFHCLDLDQRTRVFERFEAGGFFLRWSFVILKAAVLTSFYRSPDVWPLIGYSEGCLSPLPAGAKVED